MARHGGAVGSAVCGVRCTSSVSRCVCLRRLINRDSIITTIIINVDSEVSNCSFADWVRSIIW